MTRLLHTLLCALMLLAVAPTPATAVTVDSVEYRTVRLINDYRASRGRARLRIDNDLTRASTWMSRDMPAYDYFGHVDHLGRSPFRRMTYFGYPTNTYRGENIAAGYTTAEAVVRAWRNSEPHRVNMLRSEYRAIGIGRTCVQGSDYYCYWVTDFGSRFTGGV